MKSLEERLRLHKSLRVIGFDDAPFGKAAATPVHFSGIVCANTRFEGMLWGRITRDGSDATDTLIRILLESKFHAQINLVLTDGIALGGFNIIDLPRLAAATERPCIAVMRKPPDLAAIERALRIFPDHDRRMELLSRAGEIHHHGVFHYQTAGCAPDTAARALERVTDQGHVPEALRLAHLIGSAIMTGQSSSRA